MGQHSRDRTGMAYPRGRAADVDVEEGLEEEPAGTIPPAPVPQPAEEGTSRGATGQEAPSPRAGGRVTR